MGPREIPTFYLYSNGYKPDALWLGHLLLGNYGSPTHVPHCRIPRLNDVQLDKWAHMLSYSGTFVEGKSLSFQAGTEVFELGNLGGGHASKKSRVISSENGRKMELKDPQRFFRQIILPCADVKEKLKLWLSVSRSAYMMMKARLMPRPEIWCLTGLIELSNVKASTIKKTNPSANIGVGSALIASLTGVPLGASVALDANYTVTCDSISPEKLVWAAQYQLVKAKPVVKAEARVPTSIRYLDLYPDYTYAMGAVLGDEKEEAFELDLADVGEGEGEGEGAEGELDETYWKLYSKAEERVKSRS